MTVHTSEVVEASETIVTAFELAYANSALIQELETNENNTLASVQLEDMEREAGSERPVSFIGEDGAGVQVYFDVCTTEDTNKVVVRRGHAGTPYGDVTDITI